MRKLIIGLLAVVSFALCAAGCGVSSASAAPEWLCGNGPILTSGNCKVTSENLELFRLQDRVGTLGKPGAVECAVGAILDEGEITGPKTALTTTVTFTFGSTACKAAAKALNKKKEEVANGCETLEKVDIQNLPWESKLEEEASANNYWFLVISKTSGKEPAYQTTCKASGITGVSDLCESTEAHTPLVLGENLTEEEEVEGVKVLLFSIFFPEEPLEGEKEFAKCSLGGAEAAIVFGENLLNGHINSKPASLEIS
jgi:hypothetical protein